MAFRDQIDWDKEVRDQDVEKTDQNYEIEKMREEGISQKEIMEHLMAKQEQAKKDQEIKDLDKIYPSGRTGREILAMISEQEYYLDQFEKTGDIKEIQPVPDNVSLRFAVSKKSKNPRKTQRSKPKKG